MSDTYTKLFSSITESTVWGEPYATRIVWVAMLAMADARGNVYGSVPGLARRANVTLDEVERALESFRSPDPYSRTKDEDGRRISDIDGGWNLVNHGKYGAVRNAEERRETKREWDRKNRPSGHARAKAGHDSPPQSDNSPTKPDQSGPTSTSTNTREAKIKHPERQAARFVEFWSVYPNRKGKADALKAWQRKGLDAIADRIIADVRARIAGDADWLRGFVPHGSTYVNAEGWLDAIEGPKLRAVGGTGYQPLPGEI